MSGSSKQLRLAAVVCACVLVAVACGGKAKKSTTPTTAGATTTVVTGPPAPLTGLPEPNADTRARPVLVVKIDNAPDARPQFGIDKADDIVEEKVEGGISRFMAVFQDQDSDKVGPVRSLRSTDASYLKPEGGMIAYSGGIAPVEALLKPAGIVDLGGDSHGDTYYKRRPDRPYEHSLYTLTPVLRTLTPKGLPAPKPLFTYLGTNEAFAPAGVLPATNIQGAMATGVGATSFDWNWSPQTKTWLRGTDGKAHMIENVGQIGMQNVIIQFTPYRLTPWTDAAHSAVDEAVLVGTGDAWIFVNGQYVKGHWSRPTDTAITTYTDAAGAPIKLTPGHTWLSLVPVGQPITVS